MIISMIGKNALVCGSTQGIGLATAQELAANGANITLLARNADKLKTALDTLDTSNGQIHDFFTADFSEPTSLEKSLTEYLNQNNKVFHVLVNNTGGPKGGLIHKAETSEFTNTFNQHLVCNHILATNLIEGMKKEGYGRIINVISTSVKQPLPNLGVSNTIRGAVANWSKTLANELGQFNITVNNVLPGATDTVRLKSIIENKSNTSGAAFDDIKNQMANASPMKRIAQPEEVANAIAFLASPAASYINGINVPVDGGRTACL